MNLALSVGIFPYVLKLLQSSARELRPLLVSIWAKILAVDSSCNQELVRDASHKYFLQVEKRLEKDKILQGLNKGTADFVKQQSGRARQNN